MSSLIKSVVHGSMWLITANVFTKGLHALLAIILIRGLSVDDYGFLMTLWGVAALLAGGLDLGMSQALLREGARDNRLIKSLMNHIIAIRFPLSVLMIICVVAIKSTMIEYVYDQRYFSSLALFVLIAFVPIADSWHFPFAFLCHIFNRFNAVSIYRSLYLISVVLTIAICVHLSHSIELVSLAYAIVTLLAIFLFCKYATRFIPQKSQSHVGFRFAIRQGLPFFCHQHAQYILYAHRASSVERSVNDI